MKFINKIGDATKPEVDSPYWIMHGCNNLGAWGAGFVLALNKTFGIEDGSPMKEYLRWFDDLLERYNITPQLGDVQFVTVGGGNRVVNMITQKDCGGVYCKKVEISIPFRYEAFDECLNRVKVFALDLQEKKGILPNLVSPWIGCGLARAEKQIVEEIIRDVFKDLDINYYLYDLPPSKGKLS